MANPSLFLRSKSAGLTDSEKKKNFVSLPIATTNISSNQRTMISSESSSSAGSAANAGGPPTTPRKNDFVPYDSVTLKSAFGIQSPAISANLRHRLAAGTPLSKDRITTYGNVIGGNTSLPELAEFTVRQTVRDLETVRELREQRQKDRAISQETYKAFQDLRRESDALIEKEQDLNEREEVERQAQQAQLRLEQEQANADKTTDQIASSSRRIHTDAANIEINISPTFPMNMPPIADQAQMPQFQQHIPPIVPQPVAIPVAQVANQDAAATAIMNMTQMLNMQMMFLARDLQDQKRATKRNLRDPNDISDSREPYHSRRWYQRRYGDYYREPGRYGNWRNEDGGKYNRPSELNEFSDPYQKARERRYLRRLQMQADKENSESINLPIRTKLKKKTHPLKTKLQRNLLLKAIREITKKIKLDSSAKSKGKSKKRLKQMKEKLLSL